jgi:two-component system sensor histidine kinase CiaH
MRSNIFKATKKRIVLTCVLVVMSGMVIFASTTLLFYNASLYRNLDSELYLQADKIKHTGLSRYINPSYDNQFPLHGPTDAPIPRPNSPKTILMISENGKSVFQSPNSYFETGEVPVLPDESKNKIVSFKYGKFNFRGKTILLNNYTILIFSNIDAEVESLNRLFQVILVCFSILIIISLFLSKHLASKVLKPIQKSFDEQVHFVQDASHEMRTPLAVIKGKLELMALHPHETIEEHMEQISQLMSELRGLEKMNKDLLTLSKEDVDTSVNKAGFMLSGLIHEMSDFYEALAQAQNKKFELIMPVEVPIFQDYQKMKQAITILLENAFKYTFENDSITLRCEKNERHICIAVSDTGIGIMQKDMNRIFERFFRSDNVRAKGIAGSGIGLSLLNSLSKILEFKISVISNLGIGTEFMLIFRVKR